MVDGVKIAIAASLKQVLSAEIEVFLGLPGQEDNKINGYTERDYALKHIGVVLVRQPNDRKKRFSSAIIPKHERMDPRISEDLAALSLAGLSTRTLALISHRILGIEVSDGTVANALPVIAEGAEQWLQRPIAGKYWCLMIDGTYFNVRRRGNVEKEPSLVVLAIDQDNHKTIPAIEPLQRDNVDSWRSVFRTLKNRGLDGSLVKIGVMDGPPGLEKLFVEEFLNSVTARCWVHSLRSSVAKCQVDLPCSQSHSSCGKPLGFCSNVARGQRTLTPLKLASAPLPTLKSENGERAPIPSAIALARVHFFL